MLFERAWVREQYNLDPMGDILYVLLIFFGSNSINDYHRLTNDENAIQVYVNVWYVHNLVSWENPCSVSVVAGT